MRFTQPLALLLLALLPGFAVLGRPQRGPSRLRQAAALALRLIIAACLVLALAGLEIVRPTGELAVAFLLDRSDSIPPSARQLSEAFVRQALQRMGPEDQAAVIAFGEDALVEHSLSPAKELGPVLSTPQGDASRIGAAVQLGQALLPSSAARRIVILSDGADTDGSAGLLDAARLAAASGVQIQVIPLATASGPETLLSRLEMPQHLTSGERFDLRLTIQSSQANRAGVRVTAGGRTVYQGEFELQRGSQAFSLPLVAGAAGFTDYRVQIEPQVDTRYQNNQLSSFIVIDGPPQVLLAAPPAGERLPGGSSRPDEAAGLHRALQTAGLQVHSVLPQELPLDPAGLAGYAGVVLVDVPASDLTPRQMDSLQQFVRDMGGGLLAVGGPTSFGVGGYFRTPLEETLPVEMQIRDELRRPSLAIVFIIDRSGSMAESSGGAVKLEMAKEAVLRSLDLLSPSDQVGVIAFDENASWVVPLTALSSPSMVKNAVASLRPGGGTDILAGVQAMAQVLPQTAAKLKHAILLTDGGADPAGIPELVQKLHNEQGVTLSTIGIGQDAAPYLPSLADLGGGRYHYAASPAAIPSIFTQETALAARAYLVEEPVRPQRVGPSPLAPAAETMPQLYGYVATTLKPAARADLVTAKSDPLLADWQYGLGRAAAFTSDATGRWGRDWLAWPGYGSFWAGVVNAVLRQPAPGLETQVESSGRAGEPARLIIEARDGQGRYINDYSLTARVRAPDGSDSDLAFKAEAPGSYSADFKPAGPGVYLFSIQGSTVVTSGSVNSLAGWSLSYSPEYRLPADPQTLVKAASLTGGKPVTADPGAVFIHDLPSGEAVRPAWAWLLALAALLLPVDIAARRLQASLAEMSALAGQIVARLASFIHRGGRNKGKISVETGDPIFAALRLAKLRAFKSQAQPDVDLPPVNQGSATASNATASQPAGQNRPAVPSTGEDRPFESRPPTEPPVGQPELKAKTGAPVKDLPQAEPGSTAASLLAAKRRKRPGPPD